MRTRRGARDALCWRDRFTLHRPFSRFLEKGREGRGLSRLETFEHSGKWFVVITIEEFDTVPVVCKRDEPPRTRSAVDEKPVLRNGACYVRSLRRPGTNEIQTYEEMRDLLESATDKGVRRFVERARAAGLDLGRADTPGDRERFDEQLGDLR